MNHVPTDRDWMTRALELAERGKLTTWPNPMVGCVVVNRDGLLGEGWHRHFGEGHAEVEAFQRVADHVDLSNASAYITLEPCSHTGKTPPCADLLIQRGVGRVVVAMADPNPLVGGRGLERLRKAGIVVDVGLCQDEAALLNRAFLHVMKQERPWITLKWAESADGILDPDRRAAHGRGSFRLTKEAAGRHAHTLRATHDAILVGMNTWLVDRPSLTTRLVPGRDPRPFVLTSGNTPCPADVDWRENRRATLLCPADKVDSGNIRSWREVGFEVHPLQSKPLSSEWWVEFRSVTSCQACLVEAGAQLAQSVLASKVWNEIHVLQTPDLLGSGLLAPPRPDESPDQVESLGPDVLYVWHARR